MGNTLRYSFASYVSFAICMRSSFLPEVGVMGAAARPFMFSAAICCIWAAAKAAMGFRYPPCATDAMIAACCCISWNKENREKISRVHWPGGPEGGHKLHVPSGGSGLMHCHGLEVAINAGLGMEVCKATPSCTQPAVAPSRAGWTTSRRRGGHCMLLHGAAHLYYKGRRLLCEPGSSCRLLPSC